MFKFFWIPLLLGIVAWNAFPLFFKAPHEEGTVSQTAENSQIAKEQEQLRETLGAATEFEAWSSQNRKVADAAWRGDLLDLKASLRLRQVAEEQLVKLGVDMVPLKKAVYYLPDDTCVILLKFQIKDVKSLLPERTENGLGGINLFW